MSKMVPKCRDMTSRNTSVHRLNELILWDGVVLWILATDQLM